MDKVKLVLHLKGMPFLGISSSWRGWRIISLSIVLLGVDIFGGLFEKSEEE